MTADHQVRQDKSVTSEAKALSSIVRVWKFTAGHTGGRGFMDDFVRKGRLAIGYVYKKGLEDVKVYNDLSKFRNSKGRPLSDNVKRQLWDFLSMNAGDVVALKLKKQVVALGIVTTRRILPFDETPLESQFFKSKQTYPNRRKIQWLSKFRPKPIDSELLTSFQRPKGTIHEITEQRSKVKILIWLVFYRNNFATPKERKLIEQIGSIKSNKDAFPRRMPTTREIAEKDYLAMDKVIKYEEKVEKRKVTPVYYLSSTGYDLESKSDRDIRYIEVKSRRGGFPVTLTETELRAAETHKDHYFLYIVVSDNEILRVRNPSKLSRKQVVHILWELEKWNTIAEHIKLD